MTDVQPTDKTQNTADSTQHQQPQTQDVMSFLKKPLSFTAPTWVFASAAIVALVLLGIALD
ncbi:hypothetical protein ABWH92_09130 [Ahrensia marina]|uniref:hypothetical protein n=1 Tax=Ahrensia marina TaxID=1514904 RepID=UPI0035D0D78B